jgi:hypothetical protein
MEASQSIENTQLVAGQRAPILAALSAIGEQKTVYAVEHHSEARRARLFPARSTVSVVL